MSQLLQSFKFSFTTNIWFQVISFCIILLSNQAQWFPHPFNEILTGVGRDLAIVASATQGVSSLLAHHRNPDGSRLENGQ